MQPKERHAALDLARFIAALIVFAGHLVFLPKEMYWTSNALVLLSPISTGAIAVLFFFALSGFVLSFQNSKSNYVDWTKRRLIRLYPVYLISWLSGLFLVIAHDTNLLSIQTLVLGVLGFQSFSQESSMVVNAPLWSLSIEIIFAFFLYFLIKLRDRPIYLVLIIVIDLVILNELFSSIILDALPYFAIGILLRNEKILKIRIRRFFVNSILIIATLYYFLIGARQIKILPNTFIGDICIILGMFLFLFLLSHFHINPNLSKMAIALGKRSFCLYAFHYPILLVFDYFLDPFTNVQFALYCVLSITSTCIATELGYRLIDIPSTAAAQRRNK